MLSPLEVNFSIPTEKLQVSKIPVQGTLVLGCQGRVTAVLVRTKDNWMKKQGKEILFPRRQKAGKFRQSLNLGTKVKSFLNTEEFP